MYLLLFRNVFFGTKLLRKNNWTSLGVGGGWGLRTV